MKPLMMMMIDDNYTHDKLNCEDEIRIRHFPRSFRSVHVETITSRNYYYFMVIFDFRPMTISIALFAKVESSYFFFGKPKANEADEIIDGHAPHALLII